MKKVIAFLMAAVMATALFAGCSKGAASSAAAAAEKAETAYSDVGGESAYPEASALTKHKIGVLWYGWTDQLSTSIKKNMDYIGTQFNCEMVYGEALTAEAAISATENLIQAGCEGIISLFVYADMVEQCNKAGVYLAQFCNGTTDAELLASEKASDYFVGIVNENDQACGAAMVDDLYERGCRNIVWLAPAAGMSTNHDNRVRGIEEALKKYSDLKPADMFKLTQYHFAHLPVWVDGNAYFNGAKAFKHEKNNLVDDKNAVSVELVEKDGEYVLKTNLYDYLSDMQVGIITTDTLGEAFEPEEKFENPDGTPIIFNCDYFGNHRGVATIPGPFSSSDEIDLKL